MEIKQGKKRFARAFLYIIKNDLHKRPYGLMEDVFVSEKLRGQGIGSALISRVIKEAKRQKCYKLIATSRLANVKAHKLYKRLGLQKHGLEFRINF